MGRPNAGADKLIRFTISIPPGVRSGINEAARFEGKRPAALARELIEEGWSVYGELGRVAFMERRIARESKERHASRKGGS